MRWCVLVVVMSVLSVAAPASGQVPAGPGGGKPDAVPAPQPKGRLVSQSPPGLAVAQIRVRFQGRSVRVESSRDVSNAVLEYADGSRQMFEDLEGRVVELRGTGAHAGKEVVRVWVKSGPNFSGDGPGYGQKFERPRPTK